MIPGTESGFGFFSGLKVCSGWLAGVFRVRNSYFVQLEHLDDFLRSQLSPGEQGIRNYFSAKTYTGQCDIQLPEMTGRGIHCVIIINKNSEVLYDDSVPAIEPMQTARMAATQRPSALR